MEEKTIRRSKIYTYFYGRNTVFQKFLIADGDKATGTRQGGFGSTGK